MKTLIQAVKAALPFAHRLQVERKAGRSPFSTLANRDPQDQRLDDVLLRLGAIEENIEWWKSLVTKIKASYTRPELFDVIAIREWLTQVQVQKDLKALVKGRLADQTDNKDVVERLRRTYSDATGETERFADTAIETVMSVMFASAYADLTRGDMTIVSMIRASASSSEDRDHELSDKLDKVLQQQSLRDSNLIQSGVFFDAHFPVELVDQKIEHEVDFLRKARFFGEFDGVSSSLLFSKRLVEGDLSRGTDAVRSRALAWCARLLSRTDYFDKAKGCLNLAKSLGSCPEIEIADAFITSQQGDKHAALNILAEIDSPSSRSAALMIVAHHDGPEMAIDWLKVAGVEANNLDPDGKCFLLTRQHMLARWEAAREVLDALSNSDMDEAPILHHLMAITCLLGTVPAEFRVLVLGQLPLEAAGFPLASDGTAMADRRKAQRKFADAAVAAQELNCLRTAAIEDEYELWLELRDPENSDNGRQKLEEKLRDTKSALRLVPLGLQFGVNLDLVAVEQEIERQIALHGGITSEAAIARFALAFTQDTPEAVANYIAQHHDELSNYLDQKSLRFLQIEWLSRAGLPERANECLELLSAEGLSEVEEGRLRAIISEAKGADSIEVRKAQFKQSDSLGDLVPLVDELDIKKDWDGLCEYGALLFERTGSVRDAERLANALANVYRTKQIVEFLQTHPDLLSQSRNLQMFNSWALYQEGALLEARTELEKLSDDRENPNYRTLHVNLAVALGDWNSLLAIAANEYAERDKRSPQELVGAAQMALHLGSPLAKDLIFAAAGKAGDDAEVLAAAYFLASSGGWESDAEVAQWLKRAAELSGDDGPLQKMTLKDILDRKPDWDRRESETWQLLSRGEIPIFLAAQSLNKSLIDLTLFPALANLSEIDPRRRSAIPAYSGKRQPVPLGPATKAGVDASALITLSYLNLLDTALDAFEEIHIPHSTLGWLLEEKKKVAFHQPSRIRNAHQVRDFLARDILERFTPSAVADSELAVQVGDELALLISEVEKVRDDDDTQRIVVRSSPVHRPSSLMQEEADLSEHVTHISSCVVIVEKLREKGQITAEEVDRARAYLQLHEKPWPNQPEISSGAILYLDDLAITYFLHLEILEKLNTAGFRAIASPRAISEANALVAYEGISDRADEIVERIRSVVSSRIESGKIKVGRRHKTEHPETQSVFAHPTVDVMAFAGACDAIISDDRFVNQHAYVDDGKVQAPILSTLDILDALAFVGAITAESLLEYRTLLRRAGYFFLPISDDELVQHLSVSAVADDQVIETAELKAIRESILRARMSDWLQLPKEGPWLDTTLKSFVSVLKGLWKDGADISKVIARSNWILDQVDIRGWAHSLGPEKGDHFVKSGRGAQILMLLTAHPDASQEIRNAYWSWVEEEILAPIKDQAPDVYAWLVEWHRKEIAEMAEMELPREEIR